jgi:phosphate-selective porin OprO and OprP
MRTSTVWNVRRRRSGIRWVILGAALTALVGGLPPAIRAEEPPPDAADHERRIKELEDTIKQLKKDERQLEVNVENQKPLAGWSDGFNLASPDGNYKLRIRSYTQLDGRFFIDDRTNTETNQFIFRRARIDLSGTVAKYFDFKIMPDFAPSTPILFDAYVDANFTPMAEVRVGKFKPPVGLERLESATSLQFIERGQATNLVPNRDYGGQLFGNLLRGAFSYQLAIVNGVADGVNPSNPGDTNDDKDFAGRIFILPFKDTSIDLLKGLGLGVAGSFGHEAGTQSTPDLPTFKTFGQNTFFQYNGIVAANPNATPPVTAQGATVAHGDHTRYNPQIYYYWQQVGLLAEYVNSTEAVKRDAATATLSDDAWTIGATYVLTGENASYRGVTPAHPFDPYAGTWGAVEVGGRYGQLEVDPDSFKNNFANPNTSARRDKEWVLGVNWYLNKNVKFVLNYAQSDFRGGARNGGDRPTEKALVGRVQLEL